MLKYFLFFLITSQLIFAVSKSDHLTYKTINQFVHPFFNLLRFPSQFVLHLPVRKIKKWEKIEEKKREMTLIEIRITKTTVKIQTAEIIRGK